MSRRPFQLIALIALAVFVARFASLAPPAIAADTASITTATVTTPSYKVLLEVEPAINMFMPSDIVHGMTGDVMTQRGWLPAPSMSMWDQGHVPNHHFEIQVTDKTTGTTLDTFLPRVAVTNEATNTTWYVTNLGLMYDSAIGVSDLHYAQNIWLPAGTFTVVVTLGNDVAEFDHVTVDAGAPLAKGS